MSGGPLDQGVESYLPELEKAFARHGVVLAYLYGSQARGGAGPLSDVDVAVLFAEDIPRRERWKHRLALIAQLTTVFAREDVFVADLAEATPLLMNEVRTEGRVLYGPDPAVRVEFEVRALREYIDTEPLRRLRREYLLERISEGRVGRYA